MAILLQYNAAESQSLAELLEATGLVADVLVPILQALVQATVLLYDEGRYRLNTGQ